MRYGEFRGNFQKTALFLQTIYTQRKGYYGSDRNQDKMVTTAPFFYALISATYKTLNS